MRIFAAILKDVRKKPLDCHVTLLALDDDGNFADSVTGKKIHPSNVPYLGRQLLDEVDEFEKIFYKTASPGELLTYWQVGPDVESGKVVGLTTCREILGDQYENQLEDWQYKLLKLDPNDLGCVEAHPEGSDRGGYVPTLTNGCYYDENGGCWH